MPPIQEGNPAIYTNQEHVSFSLVPCKRNITLKEPLLLCQQKFNGRIDQVLIIILISKLNMGNLIWRVEVVKLIHWLEWKAYFSNKIVLQYSDSYSPSTIIMIYLFKCRALIFLSWYQLKLHTTTSTTLGREILQKTWFNWANPCLYFSFAVKKYIYIKEKVLPFFKEHFWSWVFTIIHELNGQQKFATWYST